MIVGISATDSLSAALLGRAVSLVVLFVLGPIFSWILMRGNSKSPHAFCLRQKTHPDRHPARAPKTIVELPLRNGKNGKN
ncbi:MAG: hypothetical protein KKE05_02980 [Nanoarchaeota archaeon]|nr:hypothetical protein [Nanoarchaeota archaeon]